MLRIAWRGNGERSYFGDCAAGSPTLVTALLGCSKSLQGIFHFPLHAALLLDLNLQQSTSLEYVPLSSPVNLMD